MFVTKQYVLYVKVLMFDFEIDKKLLSFAR